MKVILNDRHISAIWNKIGREFCFHPSCKTNSKSWLSLPMSYKKYHLNEVLSEAQEKIINSIFCKVNAGDMYALDWQHDCFIYNPCEEIPFDYCFYDADRNCNVCFPSYYPNGDYHFFASHDWSIGLYGHPWRQEIFVAGEQLIQEFDKVQDLLNITEL